MIIKLGEKMKPYDDEWYIEAGRLARNYCPTIFACKKCGMPCVNGYCCTYCGDSNPSETKEQEKKESKDGR